MFSLFFVCSSRGSGSIVNETVSAFSQKNLLLLIRMYFSFGSDLSATLRTKFSSFGDDGKLTVLFSVRCSVCAVCVFTVHALQRFDSLFDVVLSSFTRRY